MVLSGTLREFILADVLQLLTQQKVTGKLLLNTGRAEGYILFSEGNVVSAANDQESFTTKLFHYLTIVQSQPKNKVRELFSLHEEKAADLTSSLEQKGVLTHQELESYATTVVLDIACTLFLWTSGNYRFDSLRTVDQFVPAGISIPVENIVMEAMRRIDEWHRMREAITEESIFVHTGNVPDTSDERNPIEDPTSFLYERINGTSPVKSLLKDSFHSEYKIYESLFKLFNDGLIQPHSDTVTRSIRAALQKKDADALAATTMPPFFSLMISAVCILLIILASLLFRGVLLSGLTVSSTIRKNEMLFLSSQERYRDAQRYFQTQHLTAPPLSDDRELSGYSFITKRDILYLSLKRSLDMNRDERYNQ